MNLRHKVLRGGVYLAMREGCGMILSLGGILLLTRIIGPARYGVYAAALGVFTYTYYVGQFGILVYLVKRQEEEQRAYHQAFTLLLLLGLGLLGVLWLGSPLLEQWVTIAGFGVVFKTMLAGLPIVLINQVPLAMLERQMNYKRIAFIELANQLIYNLVAIGLAFKGMGVWALVLGWWAQQIQSMLLLYGSTRYRPQFTWHVETVRAMVNYSLGYSASLWLFQSRALVNPLLVGRFAGAEAVAYIALASRMVEVLGFVRSATYRISISALARLQTEPARLRRAITDGMNLQVLAVGPLLVAASWLAPIVIPWLFGEHWRPVTVIFPLLGLSFLVSSLFNLHSSALYVLQRNWQVGTFHAVQIAIFAGMAAVLIPRLGLVGYGLADIMALLTYGLIHFYLNQAIGSPSYQVAFLWCGAFGLALFPYQLGWWVLAVLVAVGLWSRTRQTVGQYIQQFRGANIG